MPSVIRQSTTHYAVYSSVLCLTSEYCTLCSVLQCLVSYVRVLHIMLCVTVSCVVRQSTAHYALSFSVLCRTSEYWTLCSVLQCLVWYVRVLHIMLCASVSCVVRQSTEHYALCSSALCRTSEYCTLCSVLQCVVSYVRVLHIMVCAPVSCVVRQSTTHYAVTCSMQCLYFVISYSDRVAETLNETFNIIFSPCVNIWTWVDYTCIKSVLSISTNNTHSIITHIHIYSNFGYHWVRDYYAYYRSRGLSKQEACLSKQVLVPISFHILSSPVAFNSVILSSFFFSMLIATFFFGFVKIMKILETTKCYSPDKL